MAKKKDLSAGEALIALGFLILPALITAIYIGSIFYIFALILPILYCLLVSCPNLRKNQEIYSLRRFSVINQIRILSDLRNNYSDLKVTQSGKYDERSSRGQGANISIENAENNLNSGLVELKGFIAPYKNFLFTESSIWSILIATLVLCALSVEKVYVPTILVCISLLAGFIARSLVSISFSNQSITPENLPQVSLKRIVAVILVWCVSSLILFLLVIENKNHAINDFFSNTSQIEVQQQNISPNSEEKSHDKIPNNQQVGLGEKTFISPIEIESLQKKTGFLMTDTHALKYNFVNADTELLKNGTQVSITGKSKDGLYLEISVGNHSKRLYVSTEAVAVFD